MRRKWIILSILALALVALTTTTTLAAPPADRGARTEVRFMEGMSDHHQMALDMANDCLKKAKADSVLTLCKNIIDSQSAEIKQMQNWLQTWYQISYNPMPMSQMMDMMSRNQGGMMGGMMMGGMMGGTPDASAMGGMMGGTPAANGMGGMMGRMPDDPPLMMGMMAGLSKLQGKDYEIAWVEAMIDHHSQAIAMAKQDLPHFEHPELTKLAQSIIDSQAAEIQKMEGLLTQFGDK